MKNKRRKAKETERLSRERGAHIKKKKKKVEAYIKKRRNTYKEEERGKQI